ncbi:uncharacterized protein V1516DRAFT_679464 [Lipomyces oligophaga]|uniref:uncharacterized protein n=1 Tax=Lipomyces oligophaga TaxID=45792 RepID=UPI0034CE3138
MMHSDQISGQESEQTLSPELDQSKPDLVQSAPIQTKQTTRYVHGSRVDSIIYGFIDKILVSVAVDGRLGKMYYVPLTASPSINAFSYVEADDEDDYSLLPLTHLTPMGLIGAPPDDAEGRMYAVQIASLISRQAPEERRTVVVSLAPMKYGQMTTEQQREMFLTIVEMVGECRLW